MNEISSRTESKTETVISETDDGHGNIVQTETTQTRTYLYITVSHKTAEEMAGQYGFDDEQRQMLSELLADENNSLWSQVLYGISVGDGEIVTVALSQVGNAGGQPYWSWYGFNSRVEWCACFVSWCANECGYIENGIIPKFAGCIQGSEWFKERGQWQDGSFTPEAGHIIFFDWEGDGLTDHVGIVERVETERSIPLKVTQAMLADRTATLSAAVLSMATVSLHIKNGQKKTRGFYSSGSFALHSPFTVASITDSSLSSKLSSCASKRLRTELFLTSLLGNIYSSTETSNIVIS